MPRYHFNVRDGVNAPDVDGTELSDLTVARREAVTFAGRVIAETAETFWAAGEEWSVDVTDDQGLVLFTLMFAAVMAPALRYGSAG